MTDDDLHSGRSATEPTLHLAAAPSRVPVGRGRILAVAAVVVLLAAVGAGAGYALGDPSDDKASAHASEEPSATPTSVIGEEASCLLLVPSLRDAASVVGALDDDDWSDLQLDALKSTVDDLEGARDYIDEGMRSDVEQMMGALRQVDEAYHGDDHARDQLDLSDFWQAGGRLHTVCDKYAA